jgi:flagellar protein FlaG
MEIIDAVRSVEMGNPKSVLGLDRMNSGRGMHTASKASKNSNEKARGDPSKSEQPARPKIERVAQAMENYIESVQRDLKIQVHKGTGDIMVSVISKEDGKIIREIPPEELLNLAARMEEMTGVLINENV